MPDLGRIHVPARALRARAARHAATGITGFDEITGGGLPRGGSTLVCGGPGAGKTVFALASLAHRAAVLREPGLFVTFEEDDKRIVANAASFGWGLPSLIRRHRLVFHDARLARAIVRGGTFDLDGLFAGVGALVRRHGIRHLVLDGVDVLLGALGDRDAERREIFSMHDWLSRSGLTTILTAKTEGFLQDTGSSYPFLPYLVDCVVLLRMQIEGEMAQRRLRILKYRGVQHSSNEFPLMVSSAGVEMASYGTATRDYAASKAKVSSGIDRLDKMLGGGFYRGSSVLVSGAPGTAKSTLGAAFAVAACRRGERTLLVSLDEAAEQIVRNMASVGIDLAPYLGGLLRMVSIRPRADSADEHLSRIRAAVEAHRARALVVDPISAFGAALGGGATDPAKRLMDYAKGRGITVLATSLLEGPDAREESTAAGVSTIADTWIHLSYVILSGERNRALTIIKSRGMGHSNQVRELKLSERGLTLTDVYTAGGEVLMGTMRWEKEEEERMDRLRWSAEQDLRRRQVELSIAETRSRIELLQRELETRSAELERLAAEEASAVSSESARRAGIERLRRGDERGESAGGRRRRRRGKP